MLCFYHKYATIYRNGVEMDTTFCGTSLEERKDWDECHYKDYLTWENLEEKYYKNGIDYNFNIWTFKKGRIISFFHFSLFKKITWDIIEWRGKPLDIVVAYEYKEFTPSLEEVYKWHDAEDALKYLEQRRRFARHYAGYFE